jgi:hypothetical protein
MFCSALSPIVQDAPLVSKLATIQAGHLEVRGTTEVIVLAAATEQPLINQIKDDDDESEKDILAQSSSDTQQTFAGCVVTKKQVVFFDYKERVSKFHMQVLTGPGTPMELCIWRRTTRYVRFTIELNSDNVDEVDPSSCDRYCCIACHNPQTCEVKVVLNTKNLQRARDWGLEIIHGVIFPLFSIYGSEVAATTFFIIAIVSAILSTYTFASEARQGRYPTLEVVQFSLSLAFFFLAFIDFIYNTKSCLLVKGLVKRFCMCITWCKRHTNRQPHNGAIAQKGCCCYKPPQQGTSSGQSIRSKRCCCWCVAPDTKDNPGTVKQIWSSAKSQSRLDKAKYIFTKYILDILRIIIVEFLAYPSIICDVLDNASSRTYQGTHMERFKFGRLVFFTVRTIVLVYIVRLFVVGSTISSLEQIRRGGVAHDIIEDPKTGKPKIKKKHKITCFHMFDKDDGSKQGAKKGLALEILFLIHIFGQMLSQGLMVGAIWYKITCENPHPTPENIVFISPFTWVMIVLGFVLPIVGVFTYFVPTYVWVQEFPIDLMVSMLSALKKCSPLRVKEHSFDVVQKIARIVSTIGKDLNNRSMHCCTKLFYPFIAPHLSIFCVLYYIPFVCFITFYFIGQLPSGEYVTCDFTEIVNITTSEYPNGTEERVFVLGWFIYFIIATALLNIFNIVVVVIGFWWVCVVPTMGLHLLYLCLPCMLCWYFCCYSRNPPAESSPNQRATNN